MSSVTVADLEPMLAAAPEAYHGLKSRAEADSVTWVWATAPVFHRVPGFHAEIHGTGPGRLLAGEPKRRAGSFEYGQNLAGAAVLLRQHTDTVGHFREEFFVARPGALDVWCYGPHPQFKDPYWVARFVLDGVRTVAYAMLQRAGVAFSETYEYAGDLLVLRRRTQNGTTDVYENVFDASGALARITLSSGSSKTRTVYERPKPVRRGSRD